MDLAKIRQKARLEQEIRYLEAALPEEAELTESSLIREVEPTQQIAIEKDYFLDVTPMTNCGVLPEVSQVESSHPSQRTIQRDPLEVILAGREIAGCGENQPIAPELQAITERDACLEVLCFKVSNEVYGIDIMDIKELIKPREVTEIPRAPSFVSGIISLRGVIIPIIDMLDRLGLARDAVTGRERVIVVRQGESFSGLLVDEIIQVVRIATDDIEAAPTVLEGIDRDFVTGIGRVEDRMIILLNLTNIIDIHLY